MSTLLEIAFIPIPVKESPSLSPSENKEWNEFTSEKRKREWLAGRLACKKAVKNLYFKQTQIALRECDIQISPSSGNPPQVNFPEIAISITHSEEWAGAIAVASHPVSLSVGIDLEKIRKPDPDWIEIAFQDQEKECAKDQPWKFFQYWTAKEAALKALGLGLTIPLTDLSIRETHQIGELIAIYQDLQLRVRSFRRGNYLGAFCLASFDQ
jgi:4'-phosphopantetheinyl transferase